MTEKITKKGYFEMIEEIVRASDDSRVEGAHTELKVEVFVGNEKKEAVLAADASEVVVA